MKFKYIILILLLCCSCTKKNKLYIETIIKNDNNLKVSIFYPKTGYQKLDKKISTYIESNYIKNENKIFLDTLDEINIDYNYYEKENIISIVLFKNENNIQEITTYNYDKKNNCFINLDYFIDDAVILKYIKEQFSDIIDVSVLKDLKTDKFSIDSDYIYIYYPKNFFTTFPDSLIIKIPLKSDDIKVSKTINKPIKRNIDINKKFVALTFDDGPSKYTKDIIKILKDNDAVATFFILGNKVKLYQDVLSTSILNGNEIGNHTFNHKWLTKLTDDDIKKQINDTQSIIEENLGVTPKLFRPSYGSLNKRVRNDIDLDIVLWNIDTMDWKYKSINKIIYKATNKVNDLDIILFHDTYKTTRDSLVEIINILKEKGFEFVTVSELKEIKKLRNEK